jgi:internalin A
MFRYWLEVISLLADQSPVIVVQNKIDIYNDNINTQNWKNNFPNIKEFRKTSCKNKEGIEELRETIISSLVELPYTNTLWNQDRFRVKETLENQTADYISHREYLEICSGHSLSANEAAFLGQQLHDIGVILHFDDDPYLKDTMVLKPEWVTEAAYCLLNNKQIPYGRFDLSILGKIWEKPSFAQQQVFLLKLMERFELVFKLHGSEEYIVPELLPVAPPSAVENVVSNTEQKLSFEYHYDFMPKGIMSHFICRIHAQIEQELFWRHGVIVKQENTFAKVIQNDTLVIKTISIEVWGKEAETLLLIIRNHFSQIHQELNNLPVKEYVPCICKDCIQSNTPYLHNYQTLKKCAEISREYYPCEKSLEDVSVNTLLRGIVQVAPQIVQELLYLIETAEIVTFFNQVSKLGIKTGEIVRLQERFIHDGGDFEFHQQLKVWVKKHFNL